MDILAPGELARQLIRFDTDLAGRKRARVDRLAGAAAGGGRPRRPGSRARPRASQHRRPAEGPRGRAAAAPPRARRRGPGQRPEVVGRPVRRGDPRGRPLGSRRARHEGRRGDARHRAAAGGPGPAAGRRHHPLRAQRRGAGRRFRRALPGRGARRALRRGAPRDRRVRRLLLPDDRQAGLPDRGRREAAHGREARGGGRRRTRRARRPGLGGQRPRRVDATDRQDRPSPSTSRRWPRRCSTRWPTPSAPPRIASSAR